MHAHWGNEPGDSWKLLGKTWFQRVLECCIEVFDACLAADVNPEDISAEDSSYWIGETYPTKQLAGKDYEEGIADIRRLESRGVRAWTGRPHDHPLDVGAA